ncbi:MAG: VWA domain-containing protein, partial [Clostridia bacterium]|nr:VWA domain-containing protein [Clostridia bacterium]
MGMRYTAISLAVLFGILSLCPMPPANAAENRTPLLQPGKKTLYQRVISHPGAKLLDAPNAAAKVLRDPLKTFSVLYVFGQKDGFAEVGGSSTEAQGWVETGSLTEWPQALTLLFSDRTGRSPVLFFKNENTLNELCQADDMRARLQNIHSAIQKKETGGAVSGDLPVVAAEPSDNLGAVARQRFYLMPI